MRIYHATTRARAQSIMQHGMIPGGMMVKNDNPHERDYAGADYCADSAGCLCFSPASMIDMRYGDVVMWVEADNLNCEITAFNGDFWDAASSSCNIDDEDCEEIRVWGEIPAHLIHISKRYTSAATLAAITR